MGKSIAQIVAELPEDERKEILKDFDMEALAWDWSFWGRPEQQFPDDDSWDIGLFLAGRGAGKTRSAAEWVRAMAKKTNEGQLRFLLVARTAADVRDVIVEGDSGILAVSPPSERPEYFPSKRRLEWANGNTAVLASADEPDSLRGPQAHYSWGDEVAAWRIPAGDELSAWDNLRFATRLGSRAQILLTTTPKRVRMLYDLLEEQKTGPSKVLVTRGTTYDNAGNLAKGTLAGLTGTYGGTRKGNQELMGELLEAAEGALWTDAHIMQARNANEMTSWAPMRIVGVDPSVAENPGDECGIVVCGSTGGADLYKRTAWVLEDASVKGSPDVWAKEVVRMAKKYSCPVVAEVNQGSSLIRRAINTIDPDVKVLEVHARQGKQLRAEPVSLAYDQDRVKHLGKLDDLEEQMVSWVPGEGKSPDRVDALVHALTALLITPPQGYSGGVVRARSLSDRRIGLTNRRPSGFSGFSVR